MKRSVVISVAVGLLLIGVIAIVFVAGQEPISLTFLEYHQSFHHAKLKLTNGFRKTITYLTDQDEAPVLCRLKTSNGWTNASRPVMGALSWVSFSNKTNQVYLFADTAFPQSGGRAARLEFLQDHKLKPGQSTEFYFDLKVDGPPIRVGVVCCTPPGKLAKQFGLWVDRVKRLFRTKSYPALPGRFEVWCNETLQISSASVNEEKR